MIQLNLLPDVKLEYIKTKRLKRLVLASALLVIAISLGVFIMMILFVSGVQKRHMNNLDKDIDSGVSQIQSTPEVNEILTVQNQLSVVNVKHDEKPAATRILPYIAQILPPGSTITDLNVDFTTGTMSVTGTTTDINAINKFVDTMKFAEYKTKTSGTKGKPFSEVVLSSYSTEPGKASFTVTSKFDPVIFDNAEGVDITIPGIVSTRSTTEKPDIKFNQGNPATQTEGN